MKALDKQKLTREMEIVYYYMKLLSVLPCATSKGPWETSRDPLLTAHQM